MPPYRAWINQGNRASFNCKVIVAFCEYLRPLLRTTEDVRRGFPTANNQEPTADLKRLMLNFGSGRLSGTISRCRLFPRSWPKHVFHADVLRILSRELGPFRRVLSRAFNRRLDSGVLGLLRLGPSDCEIGNLLIVQQLRAFDHGVRDLRREQT